MKDAVDVQAGLTFYSSSSGGSNGDLRWSLKAEVNEIMTKSFERRLARVQKMVDILVSENGSLGASNGNEAAPPAETPSRILEKSSSEAQTEGPPPELQTRQLSIQVAKALRRANKCAEPIRKHFGPTPTQEQQIDPPEKHEGLVREVVILRSTQQSLERSLGSRDRQIKNLSTQLEVCNQELEERTAQAKLQEDKLAQLQKDPSKLVDALAEREKAQKKRVSEASENVQKYKQQAKHCQALAHQQRAFFLQSERVAASGGQKVVSRHPCGEIMLVPQPFFEEGNIQDAWDIGTAIANPYVCDSWPFEPNVLARRCSQEGTMPVFQEETEEDLEEENSVVSRFRRPGIPALRMRGLDADDSDEDDGPSGTARSA
eukprot:TRINITY_DN64007_c0_g1_i1.p1 TRINITY_DN64007_c0_g1~~TRINITY_DN64007_c0_g1_i1.p1  ORF type:complete len:374 (-),score=86.71 TRINITY_DN64007_c0_g1_i1:165-1286(-)